MRKKLSGFVLGAILLHFGFGALAQGYVESALLFSRTKPGGSARIQGAGGAQIALGGDFSSALSNPAGIGMYNRSEISLTPGYSTYNARSLYLGSRNEGDKTGLNIPGLGFVFHMPAQKGSYLGGSFALTFSRTNDFNGEILYNGVNENTSIIDYFIDDAAFGTTAQFEEGARHYNTPTGLAYFNYLIGPQTLLDPPGPDDEYFSDIRSIPFQQEEIRTRGASNQWSISYGGNYNDMIFFGGGIGITTLRYKSEKLFTEDFDDDPFLRNLALQENLDIRGTGINATLGVIVRPVNFLQVGASVTTPTYYQLSETYSADMTTSWKNFDYYGDGSVVLNDEHAGTDLVTSDYTLTMPFKFSTGIAFISKHGYIAADAEFVNPSRTKYGSETMGVSYTPENEAIRATYKPVTNLRIGGEFRYEIFRVRAGYAIQGNTFSDDVDLDNQINTISAGVGVRTSRYFIDLAWVQSSSDEVYNPYTFAVYPDFQTPQVDLKNKFTQVMLTLGVTF
ncbi:MAG TPA: hypothetical protein VF191_00975 [Cyclobacteriaceae bacterium]